MMRRIYDHLADRLGLFLGQRDVLTPPQRMFSDPDRIDGSHDVREFILIGESTVKWLINCGLQPNHKVLEIGCGIGRIAIPLTKYLGNGGSYEGIDITTEKVNYCRKTIGDRYPNFYFQHADLYNKYYNPQGKLKASKYRFPYENDIFDFVFLISVFTHMLPEGVEQYLAEIARILKPSGKCAATFYLMNLTAGDPFYNYSDVCYIDDENEPEHGVVYDEAFMKMLFDRYGLHIEQVFHGSWRRREGLSLDSYQDFIIACIPSVNT